MRYSLLVISVFSTFLLGHLQASPFSYLKPEGFYISSTVGASILNDSDLVTVGTQELSFKEGMGVTAALGHHFLDSWRIELEYSYRQSATDRLGSAPQIGNISSNSVMMNFIYDVNINYHFFWYVGLGLGFSVNELELNNQKSSDLVFSQQGMTGFGYRLSRKTSFVVGYRIFHSLEQDYNFGGVKTSLDNTLQHIFELGLRYDF